jgi:hypothetical protein
MGDPGGPLSRGQSRQRDGFVPEPSGGRPVATKRLAEGCTPSNTALRCHLSVALG